MKKIFTTLTVALAAFTSVSFAQQDPQFTQFMNNKLIYNPGYAGTSDAICANVLYRQQWVNFPGFAKTTFVRLALSWKRQLGAGNLGIGIDGGILQQSFSGTWVTPDGVGSADASIPNWSYGTTTNSGLNKLTYDFGFGAYYTIPNKMYVGLSSTHLAAQDIKSGGDIKYALARHYYLVGGYTFDLNPKHAIQPNVKVKSDAASTQLDVNLTYIFDRTLSIGVSWRMQDAIAPMIGYRFLKDKSLRFGYSYDLTTSKIKGYSSGTHEISLGYCFNVKKPKKVTSYQNARFLD
jgi:type IX secretion system PorP/SprF family membrane protein